MIFSFLPTSASALTNAGEAVDQLMVASTWPVASIGTSAAGSTLSRVTLLASTPFALRISGQITFDAVKVAVATRLPSTSLSDLMLDPSTVNSASGCIGNTDMTE